MKDYIHADFDTYSHTVFMMSLNAGPILSYKRFRKRDRQEKKKKKLNM